MYLTSPFLSLFAAQQFFPRSAKRRPQLDLHTPHCLVQRAGIAGDERGRCHRNSQSHNRYRHVLDGTHSHARSQISHFSAHHSSISPRHRPYSREPPKLRQQRVLCYHGALGNDGAAAASSSPRDQRCRLQVGGGFM